MILYLDTSALLKLYLEEIGSEQVRVNTARAGMCLTHLISYTECHAALALALRMQRIGPAEHQRLLADFERDWQQLSIIAVDEMLVRRAGQFALEHELRGYDSVHLAAMERVALQAGSSAPVQVAAFDDRLQRAAGAIGLNCS